MASTQSQAFFVRSGDGVKILNTNPSQDEAPSAEELSKSLVAGQAKVAAWSPEGLALAVADPEQGVVVLELGEGSEVQDQEKQVKVIDGSSKTTMHLFWSPMGSTLVSVAQVPKTSQEPNLQVWRRSKNGECDGDGGSGEYLRAAEFIHPKLERDKKVLEWTLDETFCARLCPDGKVVVTPGEDLATTPLLELQFPHPAENFAFAPLRSRGPLKARLAVFVPDCRDAMQQVIAPGEVNILEIINSGKSGTQYSPSKRAVAQVSSGQNADLMWSPTGTAVLAHCTTEVDETGKSYYGGSKLVIISSDGQYTKDLTDEVDQMAHSNGTSVQAVAWSPKRDEFILIQGFQPAQVMLWSWDEKSHQATLVKVLVEKAHRNTIRFNSFGSLVAIAGFGNLAGDMDFFGRSDTDDDKCDYVKVSSCTANCTVSSEWAPDGRHLLTSVLAPRMRVDNAFSIWRALEGAKVIDQPIEELLEAQWRPENPNSLRFLDISPEEVDRAGKVCAERATTEAAAGNKKQAYRPPKARGEVGTNSVAAMMRGEAAMPAPEDRRRRQWQPNKREEDEKEKDPQSSPPLGPRGSPRDPNASPSLAPSSPPPVDSPSNEVPMTLPPSAPPTSPPPVPEAQQGRRSISKDTPEVPRSRPPPPPAPPPPGPQAQAGWAQERGLAPERSPPPSVAPVPPKAPPTEPPSVAPAKAQGGGGGGGYTAPPTQPPQQQPKQAPPSQPPHPKQANQRQQQQQQQQQAEMNQQRQQQQQQRQAQEHANDGIGKRGQQVPPRNAPPPHAAHLQQQAQAQHENEAAALALAMQYTQRHQQGPPMPGDASYNEMLAYVQRQQAAQQAAAMSQLQQGFPPGRGSNAAAELAAQHAAAQMESHRQQQAYLQSIAAQRQQQQQQAAELARQEAMQQQRAQQQQAQQQQQRAAQQAQQQAQQQAKMAAQHGNQHGRGENRPQCPQSGWQYVDPKGNVQGPFTLLEMQLWHSMGYFRPDLPMRCDQNDSFVEFNKMFPQGYEAFVDYPRRPNNGANGGNAAMLGR